ncbi:hypothetical protein [Endozoicomonas sp. YOMI1]|uniref:hypothetical protein n=1 Tax=Endozoicomonas sp. YOMI1 TaxID=2828739 RepID=UPI0021494A69|nr:hypothetical protein [Endozoicomonas sp. YOMI1]
MLPVTSSGYPDRSAGAYPSPSAPDSSEFAKGLFENFKHQLNFLPPGVCSEYIRNILTHVSTEFPDDMSEFQKALNERTVTLAENSSETRTLSILPIDELMLNHEYYDLSSDLDGLLNAFNSELTNFNKLLNEDLPISYKKTGLSIHATALCNFGKYIFDETSPRCIIDYDDINDVDRVKKEKKSLETWHKSIKTLCDGVLDPILAKPGRPDHNASAKKVVINLLNELQTLISNHKGTDYIRFYQLIRQIEQDRSLGSYHRSHLSNLILEDFIPIDDPVFFQKTLQKLFSYYQFTPDVLFDEISTDLCDTIKMYAKMKRPLGHF